MLVRKWRHPSNVLNTRCCRGYGWSSCRCSLWPVLASRSALTLRRELSSALIFLRKATSALNVISVSAQSVTRNKKHNPHFTTALPFSSFPLAQNRTNESRAMDQQRGPQQSKGRLFAHWRRVLSEVGPDYNNSVGPLQLCVCDGPSLCRVTAGVSSEALTDRELEVRELLARGRSNKKIGAALFIGETTVKSHLRNIFGKSTS
jgi:ATP/maltotriose-dependent transcriptional regulator MalT